MRVLAFILGTVIITGFFGGLTVAMAKDLGWAGALQVWGLTLGGAILFGSSIFFILYGLGVPL